MNQQKPHSRTPVEKLSDSEVAAARAIARERGIQEACRLFVVTEPTLHKVLSGVVPVSRGTANAVRVGIRGL